MANNNVQINSNEIFDYGAYYDGKDMKEVVTTNIINDYQVGGVKTTKVSIFVSNMENQGGTIIRNMTKGELIQINDIVCVNGKDEKSLFVDSDGKTILFKVTGREFRYEGQPLMELELQQVKGDYTWLVNGLKVIQI